MSQPNVTIVCSIMLEHEGKLLLIKEARPNVRGKWNTPAGHLEDIETPIMCALREAKEESGYDVELTGIQAVYHRPSADEYIIDYCFLARPKNLNVSSLADDVLETHWFSREEVEALPRESLRSARTAKRLEDWLAGKRYPLTVITQPPI